MTDIFPSLNVQIGFLAASDAVNTAPYMTFNDPVNGLFDTGQFAPAYFWTNVNNDITPDIRSCSITRGRQRQIETFSAGTATVVLDNNAGDYDPDNPDSIYYGAVLPMRPIRITAGWNGTTYPLFYGYIDTIVPGYAPGQFSDAWVTISATDGMKILQNIPTNGGAAPQERTGARIARILDAVNWPTDLRDLATGDLLLVARSLSSTAGADIQTAVDSEYGRWYIDAEGNVKFESRSSRNTIMETSTTWTDNDTLGILYSDASRIVDDDLLRNSVSITNDGGTEQTVSDATSITAFQERSYSSSGLWLLTDEDARQLALVVLYIGKQIPGSRLESVRFEPITQIAAGAAGDLWPTVLGTDISDAANVEFTPPNTTPFSIFGFVEGVTHSITAQPVQDWQTSFAMSRGTPQPFLLFNDATFGTIGTVNTFGY